MKQNIFETRQRADELLKEAIAIWQQSDRSESLAGLENDPVFRMLINAIAYQSIEMDSNIEQLKVELLDEFRKTVMIGEGNKPIPATTVLTMKPSEGLNVMDMTSEVNFVMRGAKQLYNFIPVLSTRVFNAEISGINRLDSRRWLVGVDFIDPIENISGMTFMVSDSAFRDVKITMSDSGMELPLIAPWEYSNLPLTDAFSLDTLMYNRRQAVSLGNSRNVLTPYYRNCAMDIFAKQDAKLFVIDEIPDFDQHLHLDLLFEFDGISDTFNLTTKNLFLNAVIATNATISTTTVTTKAPLVRIAGMSDRSTERQFLYLLRPDEEQIYGSSPVQVRRIYADRFNAGRLQKLLHNLLAKYNSDYYAFQEFGTGESDAIIRGVRNAMTRLENMSNRQSDTYEGVYLILTNNVKNQNSIMPDVSMNIRYLTTDGASINKDLSPAAVFDAPQEIDAKSIRQIASPQSGMDEIYDDNAEAVISRYFNATNDRLVTPADIKLFCLTELTVRYSITSDLVSKLKITRGQRMDGSYRTYFTTIDITLHDTIFVQRAMSDKLHSVEHFLQKMIEVRTNNMYPVEVKLSIKS